MTTYAAGRREGWQLTSTEDGDRASLVGMYRGLVGCGGCPTVSHSARIRMRRRRRDDGGHGREIVGATFCRAEVIQSVVWTVLMVVHPRRGSRSSALRHVDDQGLVGSLTAGVVAIEHSTHFLVRRQKSLRLWTLAFASCYDAQSDVGRVEIPPQRIRVFPQNHVAYVVDEIILLDRHHGGRCPRPFDPYLPRQHAGKSGRHCSRVADTEIVYGRRGDGSLRRLDGCRVQEGAEQSSVCSVDQRLAAE